MITLYQAGGASAFALAPSPPNDDGAGLLGAAQRLLLARGAQEAAEALRAVPFRFVGGTNDFDDEFELLFAEVSLEEYERIRLAVARPEGERAYRQIAAVMNELGRFVRFIAVELKVDKSPASGPGLTNVEVNKLVYKFLGVNQGYLADFSYRTHREFYIDLDLDIDPNKRPGTTRERFTAILMESAPEIQARILEGVLKHFPVRSDPLRTQGRHDEIRSWIMRLAGVVVSTQPLRITSAVVERALADAEGLIATRGATSGVDRVHTALHGYCIALCRDAGITIEASASMTELFKKLSTEHPAFKDAGPRREDVMRVLRSMAAIVDAMNPLRNKTSVAHPNAALLPEAEARLAINSMRTLLDYLDRKASRDAGTS